MHIVSVINYKGGVGKTTITANLSAELASRGHNVLMIDLDPQGNATVGCGIDKNNMKQTVNDVLLGEANIHEVIIASPVNFDVLPADSHLTVSEVRLLKSNKREKQLKHLLEPIRDVYDFILIDCPPNLNLLTVNSLCASDGVIIPLQCEYFAMRAVKLLLDSMNRTKARLNPDLELIGILATMYSTGTIHAREVLEELRSVFGERVFDVVIYKSIRFAEASVANQSIIEYSTRHKGARAYRKLAKILVEQGSNESEPAEPTFAG